MSRKPSKKTSLPVVEEETPPLISSPPAAFRPSCGNCPFFTKVDETWGKCIRRLASYTNPKNLTPYGPAGNFYYMTPEGVCGDHPHFFTPPN